MKSNLFLFGLLILLVGCENKTEKEHYSVLKGATIFIGNGSRIAKGTIVIKEGVITAIGDENTTIPEGADIIDVTGKYITPGLIDAHVHFMQTGFFDARPDQLDIRDSIDYNQLQARLKDDPDRYYEAYLRSGVTAVYDVGGFNWTLGLQQSAEKNLNAPHVAASGMLLTPASKEQTAISNTATDSVFVNLTSPEIGRRTVRLNDSLGATGIKIHQLFLQDTVFMKSMLAVQDEIAKTNNKMIVHATTLEQAKQALRFNAKILVHSVDDYPIDDEFVRLAKEMNVIYCPTLIVLKGYLRAFESLQTDFILNDPNNAVDADTKLLMQSASSFFKFNPHGENFEVFLGNFEGYVNSIQKTMFDNLKRVHEEGITVAVSTDAGNPGTLYGISIYDEMEAMQAAGIEAEDIIQMATKNGAMAMERLNDFGTLETGKMADLIVLDSDPSTNISNMRSITHVMRGGFLRPVNEPFQKRAAIK